MPCLRAIDRALVAKKWVPISPGWWRILERCYRSKKRNMVGRGGRRAGKSSTVVGRVAVFEMLSTKHVVPPGDIGWFIIISADKTQAKNRLKTAHKALTDLDITHRATTEEITLGDRPIGMKAIAATLEAVVSDTCIGCLCDEMARWRDKDSGANPAKDILTSLKPSMATMPNAIAWYISAPWSTLDEHHKMFEAGNDETQEVFFGATWDLNPTITEEDTRKLERDKVSRDREYGAIPMSSDESKFFAAAFVEAAKTARYWPTRGERVGGGDFAFKVNSSALVVMDKNADERMTLRACEERVPGEKPLRPSVTIKDLIGIAAKHGCGGVACDLHYIESVREVTDDFTLALLSFPNDNEGIAQAYIRARVLLSDGLIDLSGAPDLLIEQLKETTSKPTVTGLTITNPVREGRHGDLVSAFVCAVWAAEQTIDIGDDAMVGSRRFARGGAIDDSMADDPSRLSDRWTN
jgi:hypothetical protein